MRTPGKRLTWMRLPGKRLPGKRLPGMRIPENKLSGKKIPGMGIPGKRLPGSMLPGKRAHGARFLVQRFRGAVQRFCGTVQRFIRVGAALYRGRCSALAGPETRFRLPVQRFGGVLTPQRACMVWVGDAVCRWPPHYNDSKRKHLVNEIGVGCIVMQLCTA